ncbi:MAG: response regulator [Deltaproteobacteria bacterium]|nr:response regulator [Deltaproteobacteria bacterium]MCD6137487.1 response regulator [Deltaproteobacteria bacterium]RLB96369.1 MAG: response regulator [Deltaproteobacteria bacterium]RLC12762.1 MAG: response regulator [Deltaproteobacteria bacterium]
MKPRILIVDDEQEFVDSLSERLAIRDFDVTTSSSGEDALEKVKKYNFDVIILDVKMPGMSGIETLREIKRIKPLTEVIMFTGHAEVETAIEGMKLGALDYLLKPCKTEDLVSKINMGYDRKAKQEERIRQAKASEIMSSPMSALKE